MLPPWRKQMEGLCHYAVLYHHAVMWHLFMFGFSKLFPPILQFGGHAGEIRGPLTAARGIKIHFPRGHLENCLTGCVISAGSCCQDGKQAELQQISKSHFHLKMISYPIYEDPIFCLWQLKGKKVNRMQLTETFGEWYRQEAYEAQPAQFATSPTDPHERLISTKWILLINQFQSLSIRSMWAPNGWILDTTAPPSRSRYTLIRNLFLPLQGEIHLFSGQCQTLDIAHCDNPSYLLQKGGL